MSFKLDLLNVSGIKRQIFEIIAENKEIGAKQIYNKLKQKHSYNSTYQATFKILQNMVDDKLIKKQNKNYVLDFQTLLSHKQVLEKLLSGKRTGWFEYASNDLKVFTAKTIKELDNFFQENIVVLMDKVEKKETYWKCPHCWWVLCYPIEENKYIAKYAKQNVKCFALISSTTDLDKKAKRYYEQYPEVYTNIKLACSESDREVCQVIGEYVITCQLPKELFKKLRLFYETFTPDQGLAPLLDMSEEPHEIKITITKNNNLAALYKKHIKGEV